MVNSQNDDISNRWPRPLTCYARPLDEHSLCDADSIRLDRLYAEYLHDLYIQLYRILRRLHHPTSDTAFQLRNINSLTSHYLEQPQGVAHEL
jgi:hypothetical protein